VHRRRLHVSILAALGFTTAISPAASADPSALRPGAEDSTPNDHRAADQKSEPIRLPAKHPIQEMDWVGRSALGEALTMVAAGGLMAISFLAIPQRRSGPGPDGPHDFAKLPDTVSYFTWAGGIALGLAHYPVEGARVRAAGISDPYAHAAPVLFADAEAVLFAYGFTEIWKRQVGRCRPRYWHDEHCDPDSPSGSTTTEKHKAFPSQHTAAPAAMAGVQLVELARDPTAANWMIFSGIEAMAISTGILRILGGAHSVTDVFWGHAIGYAMGAGVALAHPRAVLGAKPDRVGSIRPRIGFDGRLLTISAAF
jgi:membrane-associated phospholipid phosphatase